MKYFLDNKEVSLEELDEEQIKWEQKQFGSYENVIILDIVLDNEIYFYRTQFYSE